MAPAERGSPAPPRGSVRTAVVWDDLAALLVDPGRRVVDLGGGTGGFAVRIAGLGHHVTVVDPSPDALAALARRAGEVGVEVAGRQGDVSDLVDVVGAGSADVVLCHGVLDVVDPAEALAGVREVLRPGGALSLLVAQRHAAVVARAMAGHLAQALALLDADTDAERGRRRFSTEEVAALIERAGLDLEWVRAVRVFTDLVPGGLVDQEPGAAAALVELERAVAGRPEYRPLAAQLHVLARRAA